MSRARVLAVTLVASALSCVPASDPLPPAGAGGVAIEPSPAARGEPFTTSDGWTLRFEKIFVRAHVSAYPIQQGLGRYGNSEAYLFDATKRAELFARAIPTGSARVRLDLRGSYAASSDYDDDDVTILGVAPDDVQRFARLPDGVEADGRYVQGPTVVISVRAAKEQRFVTLDLALPAVSTGGIEDGQTVEIRANDVAFANLGAVPELVFSSGFDRFASADGDGDGQVTAVELAGDLLDELTHRAAGFLVPR